MNCLKVDQGDGGMALKEPSVAGSSSGVMTMTTGGATSAAASMASRNNRSWSTSHVDSVGESTHSEKIMVSLEQACKVKGCIG